MFGIGNEFDLVMHSGWRIENGGMYSFIQNISSFLCLGRDFTPPATEPKPSLLCYQT